jgi:hypothetical protein
MKQRRATRRRSDRVRDVPYMLAVKQLPCCARLLADLDRFGARRMTSIADCSLAIEADHAGVRPAGRKCSDRETIPLCSYHHICRTDRVGPFRDWSRAAMRAWLDARIADTQQRLAHLIPAAEAA